MGPRLAFGLGSTWLVALLLGCSWLRSCAGDEAWAAKLDHGSFKGFPTFSEADDLLEGWLRAHPNELRKERIGASYEGRPLDAYVLTAKGEPDRPQILFTALMHAREPASLTVVLYIMGHLLELYSQRDPLAVYAVENRELWFIPFVNPDGYIANQKSGRPGVRKNGRPTCANKMNSGVDINRNFAVAWKAGTFPACDEEYQGKEPFSEPETKALKGLCDRNAFKAAMNFHAFGSMLTHPYNWAPTAQKAKLDKLDDDVIFNELQAVFKFDKFGPAIRTVGYTAPGESDDWFYGAKGIISMSPEVGPESGGFFPPASAIAGIDSRNFARAMHLVAKSGLQLGTSWRHLIPGLGAASNRAVLELTLKNSGLSTSAGDALAVAVAGLSEGSAAPGVAVLSGASAGAALPSKAFAAEGAGLATGGVAFRVPALGRRSEAAFRLSLAGGGRAARTLHLCVLEARPRPTVCQCSGPVTLAAAGVVGSDFKAVSFVLVNGAAGADRDHQIAQALCTKAAEALSPGFGSGEQAGTGAHAGNTGSLVQPSGDPSPGAAAPPTVQPTAAPPTAAPPTAPGPAARGQGEGGQPFAGEPVAGASTHPQSTSIGTGAPPDIDAAAFSPSSVLAGGALAGLATFAGVTIYLCRRAAQARAVVVTDEEAAPALQEQDSPSGGKNAAQPRMVGMQMED
mmetsp:Transcript_4770/g.18031  ORF Transcript_4770/g.18031 Transcript_4770/m.18031 type:complete len:683 (-) Transcript_4770:225-2273(-)